MELTNKMECYKTFSHYKWVFYFCSLGGILCKTFEDDT